MPEENEVIRKEFKATNTLKKVMADHFHEMDEQGRRLSFKMNRKCAAGTGAFLVGD